MVSCSMRYSPDIRLLRRSGWLLREPDRDATLDAPLGQPVLRADHRQATVGHRGGEQLGRREQARHRGLEVHAGDRIRVQRTVRVRPSRASTAGRMWSTWAAISGGRAGASGASASTAARTAPQRSCASTTTMRGAEHRDRVLDARDRGVARRRGPRCAPRTGRRGPGRTGSPRRRASRCSRRRWRRAPATRPAARASPRPGAGAGAVRRGSGCCPRRGAARRPQGWVRSRGHIRSGQVPRASRRRRGRRRGIAVSAGVAVPDTTRSVEPMRVARA